MRKVTIGVGLLSVVALILIWYRTGLLPASSTGDEVWASESAWWLLHDGVLRRDMHSDRIGSAVRDFLPPVPALGQAAAFSVLGLSQFSMGLCASLGFTAIVLFAYLLGRRFGLERWERMVAAFSFAFLPASAAQILGVRYEVYVVLLVVMALWLLDLMRRESTVSPWHGLRWVAGGLCFGAAGIAYFGSSVGLAACFAALIVVYCVRRRALEPALWFCLGAATPIGAYGLFIFGAPKLFVTQMLESAGAYSRVGAPTWHLLAATGFTLLLVCALLQMLRTRSNWTPRDADFAGLFVPLAAGAMLFWAMSAYYFPRYTLFATTLTSLCVTLIVAAPALMGARARPPVRILSLALFASAMALFLGAGVKAVAQRSDRDYSPVAAEVARVANLEGLVLTETPGWLALRPLTHAGQLHHLLPRTGDPSDLNSSTVLSSSATGAEITSVFVRVGRIDMYRKLLPAVDAFMSRDDVAGPIDIAGSSETYHLQAYVLQRR